MNHKGTITSWHDDKGYGFISPRAGGGEVFVHVSAFDAGGRRPQIGDVVRYGVSTDSRGRVRAARAAIRGAPGSAKRESTTSALPPIFVVGFLAVIGGAAITSAIPTLIPPLYLVVSALTFTVYALDKSAARRGAWRISESTLHFLALAGGWPGALIAQQRLRHKSRKPSFQAIFRVTVVVNCATLAWFFTPDGARRWESVVEMILRG